jgi:hypothetical protein
MRAARSRIFWNAWPADEVAARKRFVLAPLTGIGVSPEDGELRFVENKDDRHDGFFLAARRFQTARDLSVSFLGREIHVERGERFVLNRDCPRVIDAGREGPRAPRAGTIRVPSGRRTKPCTTLFAS